MMNGMMGPRFPSAASHFFYSILLAGLLVGPTAIALEGTLLVTTSPWFNTGRLVKIDCATGTRTEYVTSDDVFGPGFSPDGTQVAYWMSGKIYSRDVDDVSGTTEHEICATTYDYNRRQSVSWTADDYIYYSEMNPYISRVDVATGIVEVVLTSDKDIYMPQVSLDSRRAAATKPDWNVWTFDLVTQEQTDFGAGCQGTISPNGELVTRNLAGHRTAYIHRFVDGSIYSTVTAPDEESDVTAHRFSRVSNDYIVYTDHGVDAYVVNIHTDEKLCKSDGQAWDFYPAAQPEPMLLLRPDRVYFKAIYGAFAPLPQSVAVTGLGLLDDVTTHIFHSESESWLSVTRTGTANTQALINAVDLTGLALGEYQATVEVSCDNATNSPQSYPVVLRLAELQFPLRINSGSNEFDVAGWDRDDLFVSDGIDWVNHNDIDTANVANAVHPFVYKSARQNGAHSFTIPIPDGEYIVRLHFADPFGDAAVDYFIEGAQILDDFDIATVAGGLNKALVLDFPVTVTGADGLQFQAVGDGDLFEAGIEIFTELPTNTAPQVEIDDGYRTPAASALWIDATVTDDGLPSGMLTYTWTKQTGPGEVSFMPDDAADTMAFFVSPGTYLIRLSVGDGELTGFADVPIVVTEPLRPSIIIDRPTGGEKWFADEVQAIQWTAENLSDVSINYSIDGGSSWHLVALTVDDTMADWQDYLWEVPNTPSRQCVILIQGYFGEVPTQSAGFFEIAMPEQITVKPPDRPLPTVPRSGCAMLEFSQDRLSGFLIVVAMIGRRIGRKKVAGCASHAMPRRSRRLTFRNSCRRTQS